MTGSAGFIASRVAEQLLDLGHEVVGVDDLNDAYDPVLKHWRLARLEGREGFTFHRADVVDRAALENAFSAPVDGVFNLAARAGVRQSTIDPWVYAETNLVGCLNVLEACRRHDVRRMLLASTSSLYGVNNVRPFAEDANTDRPLSPYAATKKAAEAMAASYAHLYGISTPIARYFTVYGPAGRPDMSVFRFVKWVTEGDPVHVHGDGSQERDFTYVDDIARGTILALTRLEGHEVVNLGGDRPYSMRDVLALVEKHTEKKADVRWGARHRADVDATWANIGKARKVLGWEPRVDLDEGIRRTVGWYRENRTWASAVDTGEP